MPEDPFHKIRQYPTDVVVIVLAKINTLIFLHPNDDLESDNKIFHHCFNRLPGNWLERARLLTFEQGAYSISICFTSQSVLFLLAKVFSTYRSLVEDEMGNEESMKRDIFEAIPCATFAEFSFQIILCR